MQTKLTPTFKLGIRKQNENPAHSRPLKKERMLHEPQDERLIIKELMVGLRVLHSICQLPACRTGGKQTAKNKQRKTIKQ
jgi:hypothetical protein